MILYYTPKNGIEVRFECNHIYYFENHLIAYKYSHVGTVDTKVELNLSELKGFEIRQEV